MASNQKQNIEEYLNRNTIPYRGIAHAPAASAEEYNRTLGTRFAQQVKVLLIRYKKDGNDSYCVAAVQGHKKVNLDAIAKKLSASKAKLADKAQLLTMTGCAFGELHPFATLFNLPLLMDEDFLKEEEVYINAGQLDYSVVTSPALIAKLESPTFFENKVE